MVKPEIIGEFVHESIRAFRRATGDTAPLPSWDELPKEKQEITMDTVIRLVQDPDMNEVDVHNQWVLSKFDDGWRYGDTYDEKKKTHPLIVPYTDLPQEERLKDSLVRGIVNSLWVS